MSYKDRFLKLNLLPQGIEWIWKTLSLFLNGLQTEIHHRTRNACKVFKVKTTTYLMQNKTI